MAVILAGGKGSRLEPLTRDRAKPAVPFAGGYRIVDFALSNCVNSGLRKLLILTQYKAMSLDRHINDGWRKYFCTELRESIDIVPPQHRIDEQWYRGTADAVYQNIYAIEQHRPKYTLILAGDHVYQMNYRKMIDFHQSNNACLTVAALPVPRDQARAFGVMEIDEQQRIVGFEEKPNTPKAIPGNDQKSLASMGVYVFTTRFLFEQLLSDATMPESRHDFGKDIIPSIIDSARVFAYPFVDQSENTSYWRDVGTLDAYYEANMDLIQVEPGLNLYDPNWPIRTVQRNLPPPKFVHRDDGGNDRAGMVTNSIVCPGTVVVGGRVDCCVLGPSVRINSHAEVSESVLLDEVNVGPHARIQRAIIDKHVNVPAGAEIGFDHEADRAQGFTVTPSGITVIGRSGLVR